MRSVANIKNPSAPESAWTPGNVLQRSCACGQHATGRQCEECGKKNREVQRRKGIGHEPTTVPPVVHEVLRSAGRPLDPAARVFMEPRFGQDFSRVRVHADHRASESAEAVNALAYTVGRNVVFASGQYAPETAAGTRLLAHELSHVVQQQGQDASTNLRIGAMNDPAEEEAEGVARTVMNGEPQPSIRQPGGRRLRRVAAILEGSDESVMAANEEGRRDKAEPGEEGNEKPPTKDTAAPETPTPKAKPKQAKPACTRTILAEGSCADLVAGSKYICCDADNGIERKGRKKDIDGTPCPNEKFTPIFTCDHNCPKALAKGCDDNDNWLALPGSQFSTKQCGDVWTICANGKQTTGYVRDRSVTKSRFEVSPGIQNALGVSVGSSFKGAAYKPGAKQATIDKDSCCKA